MCLRPAQDLDPVQVNQVKLALARSRVIDTIEVDTDAVLQPIVGDGAIGSKTADVDAGIAWISGDETQAGYDLLELGDRIVAPLGKRISPHDAQCDRHLLSAFLAMASGDHDISASILVFGGGSWCGN